MTTDAQLLADLRTRRATNAARRLAELLKEAK